MLASIGSHTFKLFVEDMIVCSGNVVRWIGLAGCEVVRAQ